MEQIWAPWRLSYVSQPAKPMPVHPHGDCFICKGISEDNDRENLIVKRTKNSVIILNRFPYNNGHLLVAPIQHLALPAELSDEITIDLQKQLVAMMAKLDKMIKPEGYNVGLNLGKVAGAGLPGHLHWHIVPRWNGDSNFMPVISDTKVIVQSLDALWELITQQSN